MWTRRLFPDPAVLLAHSLLQPSEFAPGSHMEEILAFVVQGWPVRLPRICLSPSVAVGFSHNFPSFELFPILFVSPDLHGG